MDSHWLNFHPILIRGVIRDLRLTRKRSDQSQSGVRVRSQARPVHWSLRPLMSDCSSFVLRIPSLIQIDESS